VARAEGESAGYVSPEQYDGRPLGSPADLWSWAVTVLEMFVGERTWPSGTIADEVLRDRLADPARCRVAVPDNVAELLAACFRADPAERPTLVEACDQMARANGVRRSQPPRPSLVEESLGVHERTLVSGARWNDSRDWLNFAYEAGALERAIAALSASSEAMAHVAPGTTTLRDLMGPAAPPITIDAMVKGTDSILADLKRRRARK
jgi:serine/threonine protein kinase